jgi:hypothetical protein
LWNASPQPHFFSDPHLPQAGAHHEVTSSSRNLPRATARMPVVCLVSIKEPFHLRSRSSQTSERRYSLHHRTLHPRHTDHNRSNDKLQKLLTLHTNPIDRRGGFLQVAVSAAPAKDIATLNSPGAGAPDTALRLVGTNPASSSKLVFLWPTLRFRGDSRCRDGA